MKGKRNLEGEKDIWKEDFRREKRLKDKGIKEGEWKEKFRREKRRKERGIQRRRKGRGI